MLSSIRKLILYFPQEKNRWAVERGFRFPKQTDSKADANKKKQIQSFLTARWWKRNTTSALWTSRDYNGFYFIESADVSNPWWQGKVDYADNAFHLCSER